MAEHSVERQKAAATERREMWRDFWKSFLETFFPFQTITKRHSPRGIFVKYEKDLIENDVIIREVDKVEIWELCRLRKSFFFVLLTAILFSELSFPILCLLSYLTKELKMFFFNRENLIRFLKISLKETFLLDKNNERSFLFLAFR